MSFLFPTFFSFLKPVLLFFLMLLLLSSCSPSIATKLVKQQGMSNEQKGKNILETAYVSQGLDFFNKQKSYRVVMNDDWPGVAGKIGKMWPNQNIDLELKYATGTFDGQVKFLSGKRKGEIVGIQSWNYYEIRQDSAEFINDDRKKMIFALSATQYFMELVARLKNAELITYAGEKKLGDQLYDLVFVTWGKLKAHKKHDQYLLWINKTSGLAEYCEYTIRDIAFPGSLLTASIAFSDYRDVQGVKIPFQQHVLSGSPKLSVKKYLHRFHLLPLKTFL